MGKRIPPWGEAPTDKEVAAWLAAKGIKDVDVRGYAIRRSSDRSDIEITFTLDDPAPVTPPVQEFPVLSVHNPNIVKEG